MPAGLEAQTIGPVDVAVVLFEGNEFNGEVAPAIAELEASGIVRIIDIVFVVKDDVGDVAVIEASDALIAGRFEQITGTQFDMLSDEDVDGIAMDLDPGSSALVIVWENTWAARLAAAIRGSKGQVLSLDRIPHANVVRAIEALEVE